MSLERLDKLLSDTGQFTRSKARVLIKSGLVLVDGAPVRSPEAKISRDSRITAQGRDIDASEYVYWMLHKPAGYISASKDELYPAVTRLMPEEAQKRGVFCVGRLDADVTGLLILTDDGAYAHRVTAPRAEVEKTYEVCLDTPIAADDVEALSRGVVWSDGTEYRPAVLVPDGRDKRRGLVTVTEGKYHEVKRLMAFCGHEILSMRRLSIGALRLDETLSEGQAKRLTPEQAMLVFHKNNEVNP